MELVELHAVNTHLHVNSRLYDKGFLLLESNHLNTEMLYLLQILTSDFLDEELGVWLYLTLVSEAPRLSFCLKNGVAEVIVAVVYEIHLKASIRYHRRINRHESEIRAKTITTLPLLNRGTESYLAKRRIIINDGS